MTQIRKEVQPTLTPTWEFLLKNFTANDAPMVLFQALDLAAQEQTYLFRDMQERYPELHDSLVRHSTSTSVVSERNPEPIVAALIPRAGRFSPITTIGKVEIFWFDKDAIGIVPMLVKPQKDTLAAPFRGLPPPPAKLLIMDPNVVGLWRDGHFVLPERAFAETRIVVNLHWDVMEQLIAWTMRLSSSDAFPATMADLYWEMLDDGKIAFQGLTAHVMNLAAELEYLGNPLPKRYTVQTLSSWVLPQMSVYMDMLGKAATMGGLNIEGLTI